MIENEGDQAEELRIQFATIMGRSNLDSPNAVPVAYLGDAVYAKYENGMIGLTLDDHCNPVMIWLEPEVMLALNHFYQRCRNE